MASPRAIGESMWARDSRLQAFCSLRRRAMDLTDSGCIITGSKTHRRYLRESTWGCHRVPCPRLCVGMSAATTMHLQIGPATSLTRATSRGSPSHAHAKPWACHAIRMHLLDSTLGHAKVLTPFGVPQGVPPNSPTQGERLLTATRKRPAARAATPANG